MTRRPANKGRKYPAEILTDSEVQRQIKDCSHRAFKGVRSRALITLLYRVGLRINEALVLKPKDLDPKAGTIRILNGKGSKSRTVGLDHASFAVIARWLDVRQRRGISQ